MKRGPLFSMEIACIQADGLYLAKATKTRRRGPMMGRSNGQQLGAVQRQQAARHNWLLTRFKLQLAALVPCHRLTATETHVVWVRVKIDPVVGVGVSQGSWKRMQHNGSCPGRIDQDASWWCEVHIAGDMRRHQLQKKNKRKSKFEIIFPSSHVSSETASDPAPQIHQSIIINNAHIYFSVSCFMSNNTFI